MEWLVLLLKVVFQRGERRGEKRQTPATSAFFVPSLLDPIDLDLSRPLLCHWCHWCSQGVGVGRVEEGGGAEARASPLLLQCGGCDWGWGVGRRGKSSPTRGVVHSCLVIFAGLAVFSGAACVPCVFLFEVGKGGCHDFCVWFSSVRIRLFVNS